MKSAAPFLIAHPLKDVDQHPTVTPIGAREMCELAPVSIGHPAWAALSTSGLVALHLPSAVREVIVLADGDRSGEAAAQASADRWQREGRRVRMARPSAGKDFNDVLNQRAPRLEESAI